MSSNSDWWATVKFTYDATIDRVPISKLMELNSPEVKAATGKKYAPFNPASMGEFEPLTVYYLYSSKGMKPDENGEVKEVLWKCYISKIAENKEKLGRAIFSPLLNMHLDESQTETENDDEDGDGEYEEDGENLEATPAVRVSRARPKKVSSRGGVSKNSTGRHVQSQQLIADVNPVETEREKRLKQKEDAHVATQTRMQQYLDKHNPAGSSSRNTDELLDQADEVVLQRLKELEQKLEEASSLKIKAEAKVEQLLQEKKEMAELKATVLEMKENMGGLQSEVETLRNTIKNGIESIKSSSGFSSAAPVVDESKEKVEFAVGIQIEKWASLLLQQNTGNHTDWVVSLLAGVFGEDEAMLLRIKPTKESKTKYGWKPFSKYFVMKAKQKYEDWMKSLVVLDVDGVTMRNYTQDELCQLRDDFPAFMSDKAQSLWDAKHPRPKQPKQAPTAPAEPKNTSKPKRVYVRKGNVNGLLRGRGRARGARVAPRAQDQPQHCENQEGPAPELRVVTPEVLANVNNDGPTMPGAVSIDVAPKDIADVVLNNKLTALT